MSFAVCMLLGGMTFLVNLFMYRKVFVDDLQFLGSKTTCLLLLTIQLTGTSLRSFIKKNKTNKQNINMQNSRGFFLCVCVCVCFVLFFNELSTKTVALEISVYIYFQGYNKQPYESYQNLGKKFKRLSYLVLLAEQKMLKRSQRTMCDH